jgi:molecular chaperone GrpE (heat shock protein)
LKDTRWLRLAQDCVYLFDELDENMANFDAPRREMARHVKTRLREILVHSNVEAIDRDPTFNENRHQLEQPGAAATPGTPIVSFVSPGFAVDRRVLRRAVVRVASENEG